MIIPFEQMVADHERDRIMIGRCFRRRLRHTRGTIMWMDAFASIYWLDEHTESDVAWRDYLEAKYAALPNTWGRNDHPI